MRLHFSDKFDLPQVMFWWLKCIVIYALEYSSNSAYIDTFNLIWLEYESLVLRAEMLAG